MATTGVVPPKEVPIRTPEPLGAGSRPRPRTGAFPSRRPGGRRPDPVAPPPGGEGELAAATVIGVQGDRWLRLLVRTHVLQPGEDVAEVVARYARPFVQPGDLVFVGQKAVSIAQGRLVRETEVRPRALAVLLSRCVRRSPFGRGLGRPATMEVALREAGVPRILLAAAVHLFGRPLGRSGDFYRIAGQRVASIDGVTDWALPPYHEFIVMSPLDPDGLARRIAARVGVAAAIVDLNDLGGVVLGASAGVDAALLVRVLRDNPLGQGPFRTPLGIARRLTRR